MDAGTITRGTIKFHLQLVTTGTQDPLSEEQIDQFLIEVTSVSRHSILLRRLTKVKREGGSILLLLKAVDASNIDALGFDLKKHRLLKKFNAELIVVETN